MKPKKIGLKEPTFEFVISNSRGLRSTKKKHKGLKKVLERCVFDIMVLKENNPDYSGLGSMKLTDKAFRGEKRMVWDPFSNSIGQVSTASGHNAGGDSDFKNRPVQESATAKHQIIGSKKNKQIAQPDPFPRQAYPDQQIMYKGKSMKIKT